MRMLMDLSPKEWNIYHIEEFYCSRMKFLVENEHFEDAHSIFEEFVVDGEEPDPDNYIFMPFHEDIS
jgi:pentatricopeptide repeat protein